MSYTGLSAAGTPAPAASLDHWYRYDTMNRVVLAEGSLVNGAIVRGAAGTSITWNAAGGWASATIASPVQYSAPGDEVFVYFPDHDPANGYPPEVPQEGVNGSYQPGYATLSAERQETYGYDAAGRLNVVTITDLAEDGSAHAVGGSTFAYDAGGRMVHQVDTDASGAAVYDRQVGYDGRGLDSNEVVVQRQGAHTLTTGTTTDYGSPGGADTRCGLGAPLSSTSTTTVDGDVAGQTSSATTYGYVYYDAAQQASITSTPNTAQPGTTNTTTTSYTPAGVITSARIVDGRPRTVGYTANALGEIITRREAPDDGSAGPVDLYYRFDGRGLGHVGTNGTLETDYATSIADRGVADANAGVFRHGAASGTAVAEFGQAERLTSYDQGSAGGSYTVRTGDTLQSIALAVFGDASLWYKLAQANGLGANNALVAGQVLTIPPGVVRSANTSSTFRPYNPLSVIGDISPDAQAPSPTTPQPQAAAHKNKCGVFGAILLVVVAVAVVALTSGAAVAALSPTISTIGGGLSALAAGTTGLSAATVIGIGAAAGAAGSIVSQGVGLATGIQDKFSFKGVALAALAGGIGGAIGPGGAFGKVGAFSKLGSTFATNAARAITSSAVVQGVSVVTGLQSNFDFAGVALAGLGAGVGGAAGGKLGRAGVGSFGVRAGAATASGLVQAASRSVLTGTSFGDNLIAVLPEVIGQTVGGLISNSVERTAARRQFGDALSKVGASDALGIDPKDPGRQNLAARAAVLLANGRSESIDQVLADPVSVGLIKGYTSGDTADARFDAGRGLLLRSGASAKDVAAAQAAVDQSRLARVDQSQPARFLGLVGSDDIVVTGPPSPFRQAANVLSDIGGFIQNNINNPLLGAGLFLYGAVTAPVSTLILTTLSYTPGIGSAISRIEDSAVGFIIDKAREFAPGTDFARVGRIALGALGVVGALVLGYKALPLLQKGIGAISSRLSALGRAGRAAETVPTRLAQDLAVGSKAPSALPLARPIGLSPTQNAAVQADILEARAAGATDFRLNQQQVNASGNRVGINRPDLQYTDASGKRVYVEYDTPSSTRGPGHQTRITANDPTGIVILKTVR